MYRVHFHEDRGYLEAEMIGFWSLGELMAFDRELGRMVERYAARYPNFPMLSDSRRFAVQSAEVSDAFAAHSRVAADRHKGSVAIVAAGTLGKMQGKRVVDERWNTRFFFDIDEARAWVEDVAIPRPHREA